MKEINWKPTDSLLPRYTDAPVCTILHSHPKCKMGNENVNNMNKFGRQSLNLSPGKKPL